MSENDARDFRTNGNHEIYLKFYLERDKCNVIVITKLTRSGLVDHSLVSIIMSICKRIVQRRRYHGIDRAGNSP